MKAICGAAVEHIHPQRVLVRGRTTTVQQFSATFSSPVTRLRDPLNMLVELSGVLEYA